MTDDTKRPLTAGITTHARRQVVGLLTGLGVGLALLGLVFVLVQTYATTAEIRKAQTSSNSTKAIVEECSTPGTECFIRQADAANAAGLKRAETVNAVVIASAYCADRPGAQNVATITACVRKALRESGGK